MTSPAVVSAYRAARSQVRHYQPDAKGFDSRFSGPRLASDALAHARHSLAREADALALSDAAREAVAALRAAREAGADGFNPSDLAAAENVATNRARALENAREAVRARPFPLNRPAYATAGTWQRPDPEANPRRRVSRFWFWHGAGVLRNVADSAEVLRGSTSRGESCSYCCDPSGDVFKDGSGLVFGVVAQLSAKDGRARFVPGSRFGGHDDAGTFDLSDIYTADGRDDESAQDARKDAARAANELARLAAEQESAYQEAWQAGAAWADAGETIARNRAKVRDLLAERRAARETTPPALFPNLCDLIRAKVADLLEQVADARKERADLADSIYGESHRSAFCEGAGGLSGFPS